MCPNDEPIIKDPNAILDYVVDWAAWLTASAADTIASAVWIVAPGLTETDSTFTTSDATIWLSGGTIGELYQVTCRVTTAGGRTEDFSFQLRIRNK